GEKQAAGVLQKQPLVPDKGARTAYGHWDARQTAMSQSIPYIAACVLVPALWGVLMYFVFGWWQRRRQGKALENRPPPIDYSI
ncbi:MAG TPA: hypothetical protein PKA88_25680, partial [Polyangiaceae bacterium]|nr:hypothetical protein [Polyangiaceae bacterium]